jgi:hypothetical protein
MIKGLFLTLTPNVRLKVHKSAKQDTLVTIRAVEQVYIGDATVTVANGFKLLSETGQNVRLANNDELHVIADKLCYVTALIQE